VTVTRNQRDSDELALSTNEQQITLQQPQQPLEAPTWMPILLAIAQDKRHDLAPATLRLWKVKLAKYSDEQVLQSLKVGTWHWFPSVDDVIELIQVQIERSRQEAANREWDHYKAEQRRAEAEGRLATDEDYALMREALRRCFGDPTNKPGEKAK
jgi:hypothetical protein